MTANDQHCDPYHFHNQGEHDHFSDGGVPIGNTGTRCSIGNDAQKGGSVSSLPYLANSILSGSAGAAYGALTTGVAWGIGGVAIGAVSSIAAYYRMRELIDDDLHLEIATLMLIPPMMSASLRVSSAAGAVVGAARGLWNAPYCEIFDTLVDQQAEVVGVCGAAEYGY